MRYPVCHSTPTQLPKQAITVFRVRQTERGDQIIFAVMDMMGNFVIGLCFFAFGLRVIFKALAKADRGGGKVEGSSTRKKVFRWMGS
jgi:hypothetical protein